MQFHYFKQDSTNRFLTWKGEVVTAPKNHNVKSAIFYFFHTFFSLLKSLLFYPKPWFPKMHHIYSNFLSWKVLKGTISFTFSVMNVQYDANKMHPREKILEKEREDVK